VDLTGHVGRPCVRGLRLVLHSFPRLLTVLDSTVGEMLATEILQVLYARPPK
jgi:hypothetical protein